MEAKFSGQAVVSRWGWINFWLIVVVVIVLGVGVFFVFRGEESLPEQTIQEITPRQEVIGRSVEGREIEAYVYGNGAKNLVFVGGIHGGYEWNSVVLAYELIDYLDNNPEVLSDNLAVTIIPNANPDGVYRVVNKEGKFGIFDVPSSVAQEPGRFNANRVDLNRNFDCKWKPTATWRGEIVSAGTAPFSEPEAVAIRDFIVANNPSAVVFWHSQADAVYASECEDGILPETLEIMNAYASAAGYKAVEVFDAYEVTGDAEGWLASIGIPAITVELKNHEDVEWERNLKGIEALFNYYGD